MLETDPSFRPVRVRDGYPLLEDLGLIGDGATAALVGRDGSICWLCLPRFDSEPVFCGLLDRDRGGHFTISPDELAEARQRYEPDTGVLITELRSPTGLVRLTDALALRSGADLTDDVPGGRGELVRSAVVQTILDRSWDEDAQTLSEHLDGGGSLDASLLALPLRQVLPVGHPRMVATAAAIAERLSAGDGLLYRYLHHDSPDGIAGDESAFVLCSFWLVDNLAMQGRLDEAGQLYASLCARASPLGLLSEQIDPSTGAFIGNFPQAFSHIGVIAGGVTLARSAGATGGHASTTGAPA
jgi:GH15 family glucan-1,4-alpha-glucosidase